LAVSPTDLSQWYMCRHDTLPFLKGGFPVSVDPLAPLEALASMTLIFLLYEQTMPFDIESRSDETLYLYRAES